MPEFQLKESFLNGSSIDIDEARYDALLHAKEVIKLIWDTEEAFTLFANAFLEFEECLLGVGIRYYYQPDIQRDMHRFFDETRQIVNLKLILVLTTSRAYEEQLHQRMKQLSKLTATEINLEPNFHSVFDNRLEYRVMHALRNHALHKQLPMDSITLGSSAHSETGDIRDEGPSRERITVDPKISVVEFCNSRKIRATTKKEVKKLGYQHLDLKFFTRGFVECLASCHDDFRKATEGIFEKAMFQIQEAHNELMKVKGEAPRFVSFLKLNKGHPFESHHLDYLNHSRLRDLRKYWAGLKSVQRGYVSSEVRLSNGTYPEKHEKIWIAK